ncbi:MAG: hydrogenase expression/formation protein HypE [Negativicutes bacterium]|nr:hydrogenase expression/formation protein HypE [Negativicutes bacterium]
MKITRAHGNGGKQTAELLEKIFYPQFNSPPLQDRADASSLLIGGQRLGHTIDGFVVSPYVFAGGDIGKLSVCGTVNDLAVSGFRPLFLSAAFMIEEGFATGELERIVQSMQLTAASCGAVVVAGDTKVVEKGALDKIFITTAGIGVPFHDIMPSTARIKPGQSIIVSGDVGRHGACIYSHNSELGFTQQITSDCEPLVGAITQIFSICQPAFMRDLTRGGLATALNEIAQAAGCDILLEEAAIPVMPEVSGLCEILGLDPLYLACEGRFIAIVDEIYENDVLAILRAFHSSASTIGRIENTGKGQVWLRTVFKGTRILDMLYYEMLPRIC